MPRLSAATRKVIEAAINEEEAVLVSLRLDLKRVQVNLDNLQRAEREHLAIITVLKEDLGAGRASFAINGEPS